MSHKSPEGGQNHDTAGDAAGADNWAKAVVDGVPPEDADGPSTAGGRSGVRQDAVSTSEVPALDDLPPPPGAGFEPGSESAPVVDGDVIGGDVIDGEVDGVAVHGASTDGSTGVPVDGSISVEDLVVDLERVTAERDQYLDTSRRIQAEFENYRKQVAKREQDARERANESLVGELLPVLDAYDGAMANGGEELAPMQAALVDALVKQGLERIDPEGGPFDPEHHEAVMHEEADDADGPTVAEVLRAGYSWKGRVLRPAMVRVRG